MKVKNPARVHGGRRRGATRISAKHQVTIPVDAMREAGLDVGGVLWAEVEAPGVLRLASAQSVLSRLAGAHTTLFADGPTVEVLRDEWDR